MTPHGLRQWLALYFGLVALVCSALALAYICPPVGKAFGWDLAGSPDRMTSFKNIVLAVVFSLGSFGSFTRREWGWGLSVALLLAFVGNGVWQVVTTPSVSELGATPGHPVDFVAWGGLVLSLLLLGNLLRPSFRAEFKR